MIGKIPLLFVLFGLAPFSSNNFVNSTQLFLQAFCNALDYVNIE